MACLLPRYTAHLSTLWPMSCVVLRPAVYLLPRHRRCWWRTWRAWNPTVFLWYRRCITVQLHDVLSDLWQTSRLRQRPIIADLSLTQRLSQSVVIYTLSLTSWLWPRAAVFNTSMMPRSPDATSRPVAPSATASTPACRQNDDKLVPKPTASLLCHLVTLLIILVAC